MEAVFGLRNEVAGSSPIEMEDKNYSNIDKRKCGQTIELAASYMLNIWGRVYFKPNRLVVAMMTHQPRHLQRIKE